MPCKTKNKEWYKTFYNEFLVNTQLNGKRQKQKAIQQVSNLLTLLKPDKNAKILDVPCGAGRHSIVLAKKGYKVTGLDISKDALKAAKNNTTKTIKNNIVFEHADMANLKKYKNQFDIVFNIWTSFGYMPTDKKNFEVMKNLVGCLKKGGKICFAQMAISDCFKKKSTNRIWYDMKDYYWLDDFNYNEKTKYGEMKWIMISKKGKALNEYYYRIRFYSKDEMVSLMKKAGLKNIKVYGGTDGSKFLKSKTTHGVFIGEKQ